MAMIIYDKKEGCCGCTACKYVCPCDAISFDRDDEGFIYAEINQEKCINCGLCKKACALNATNPIVQKNTLLGVYKIRHQNEKVVKTSSSGGIFTALYTKIIQEKGSVYGVALDDKFKACHQRASSLKECRGFRGSKYVQSDLKDIYVQVGEDLKVGKSVLFSGTPCQNAGLTSYLGVKKISCDSLYQVDFICHGVPSPIIWKQYLQYMSNKYESPIKAVRFRCKDTGWRNSSLKIIFTNRIYRGSYTKDKYLNLFGSNINIRPVCYSCPYTNLERPADITIGDYWKIEKGDPMLDDNKGVSMVLVNSIKGQNLLSEVSEQLIMQEATIHNSGQVNLKQPTPKPKNREAFWNDYYNQGFNYALNKYGTPSLTKKTRVYVISPVIKKLGLYNLAVEVYGVVNKNKN